jgi:CAAX protease family protein
MAEYVKKYPALSLFILASLLAVLPVILVSIGLLPSGFSQLGALSASASGIILAAIEGRKKGVRELLSRVLIWKVSVGWWAFALFFTAAISMTTLILFNLFSGINISLSGVVPWYDILSMAIILTILAGLGEEFGWRGFLIPRLQIRHSALTTSLIIGTFHTLWHLPMFFMPGQTQYGWVQDVGFFPAFLGYAAFVIAWAIQLTWVFNNTKGSVLLAAIVHGVGNTWIGGYYDIHGRIGMEGNYILTALMVATSVLIIILAGSAHLSRTKERQKLALQTE